MPKEIKTFNVRIPKEVWSFLKRKAVIDETTMNDIVNKVLDKYMRLQTKKISENDLNLL